MPDSPALRARRYRQHRQGDHSSCRHDRPYWDGQGVRIQTPAAPSSILAEHSAELDPEAEMRALAGRLAEAYRADPANAAVARELRLTLLAIPPGGDGALDVIDMLQREEWDARHPGAED